MDDKFKDGQEIDEATYKALTASQQKPMSKQSEFEEGQEIDEATYMALTEKQQKSKQATTPSPKATTVKPPTPMQGETKVDAALREAEEEAAKEGYSTPKEPSPETLTRFDEKPLPTFMDSPFPVPGAGMMRVQELNHKIKSTQKRLQALDIRYKANTITPNELQEFKTLIAEIQSDEQKARDEIELYEEFNKKENKRILADGRSMERGDVITSKVQGDLVKIMHGGIPSLKRVKNDAFWDNTRGGWWFDETTPAPDTAFGYNPPVVNEKNIENQAAKMAIDSPGGNIMLSGAYVKNLKLKLQDPANQTTWVERNGKKMLIRVGDGAERMQNGPEGEGFYRTEIHGVKKDGTPDVRLVKVEEVLDPKFSRDAIKAKKEFRKEEVERLYAEQSTLGTQTRKAAVSIVKGATTLLGAKKITGEIQDLQDIYTAMLDRDLQFRGDTAKMFAKLSDQTGQSAFEMMATMAAGVPVASLAEAAVLSRIAQPVTKIGKVGRYLAGRSVYGAIDALPETAQMVNGDRWQLEAKLVEDGYSIKTAHDIAGKNAARLALMNGVLKVGTALNPFGFENMVSKGIRSAFSEGTKRAVGGMFEQTAEELAELTQKQSWKQIAAKGTLSWLTESHLEEQPQNGFEKLFETPFDVEHNNFFQATGKSLRLAYATKEGWAEAIETYPLTLPMGFVGAGGQGRSFTKSGKAMLEAAQAGAATPAWIPEALKQKITAFNEAMSGVVNHLEAAKAKGEPVSPLDEARVKNIEKLVETVNETGDITMLDERIAIAMNPTAVVGKSGQDYLEHAGAMTEFLMAASAAGADSELLSRHTASFRAINDVVEQATKEHLDAVEATKTQDIAAVDTKEHRRKVALAETTKHKARVAAAKAIEALRQLQPQVQNEIQESVMQAKEDLLNPFGNEEETALQGEEELDVTLPTPEAVKQPTEATRPVEAEELDVTLPTPEAVQQPTEAARPVGADAGIFAKSGYEGDLPDTDVRSIYEERMTALNQELDALVNADEGLLEDPEASQILNELPIDLADLTEREYKGNLQPESRLPYGTKQYQDARSIIETKLNRLKEIAAARQGEVDGQGSQTDQNEVSGTNVSAGVTSDASEDRLPIKIGEYGRIEIADAKKEFADWIEVNAFTDSYSNETANSALVTIETLKDNCSLVSLDNGTKAFVGVRPDGLGIDMIVFGDSMGKEAYSVNIGFAGEATASDRVYVDFILSKSRATGEIVNAGSSGMGALCYSTVAKIIKSSLPNVKILDGLIVARASFIARSRFKGSKFIVETSHLETPIENLVNMQLLDKFDATTKSRLAHIFNRLGTGGDQKLTEKEKASLLEEYKKIMSGAVVKRSIVTNPVRLKAHLLSGSDNAYYAVASKALPWEKDSRRERFHAKVRNFVKTEVILPGQKKAEAKVVVEPKAVESAKPVETPKAKIDTTKPVKEQLKTMLLNTGLYTEEDAVATAEVCGRVTESLAKALGVDPIEFFNEYGINVVVDEELDGALHQSSYHGAGVDFDKFSLDFVGAGEGGKKFGWGVYTTQDKKIAEYYKKVATRFKPGILKLDGIEKSFAEGDADAIITPILSEYQHKENTKPTVNDVIKIILDEKEKTEFLLKSARRGSNKAFYTNRISMQTNAIELLSTIDKNSIISFDKPEGQLYEVDVPENEHLLNLYKRLNQQPEYIQERIKDVVKKYKLNYGLNNGWDLYQALVHGRKSTVNELSPGDNQGLSEGNYRAASLTLNELGVEGLTFLAEGGTGGSTGDVHNFVVFNADAVNIIKKYHQEKRGSIVFGNKEIKISLLKGMDKSTFLHEFGHFMLEAMSDIIDSGKASEQIKKDYAVLLRFLGAKNRSDIKTPQHEKFARAWEKYLGQGKAPVKELEGIFKMFSKWFTAIYKTLSALDVRLSKDVKEVFDRLVTPEASVRGGKFTEKFKQWFGASKVVDKNGNPLVVIHGTRSPEIKDGKFSVSEDVMQSDPGFRGRGIYLAPKEGSDTSKGKYGPNIYPFYVRIEKPLVWKQENIYEQLARYIKTNGKGEYDMSKSIMDKLVSIGKEEGLSNYLEGFKLPGDLTKLLKEEGYDGVIREKDGSVEEYVVFSPGQIKSALVNTGEYSRKDERVFAQSPVTKVTVDGKTHEVTNPDKIASLTAAKSNADALQDSVRQNTELSKEEKHDLHIQAGNAHRDYKKAVIENERINRVPTNISDALGIKGIDWFYATTDTYLKAVKAARVKNAEGLRKLLKSKGLGPMAVDTGVALFESFNTFGDQGSNPVAGVEGNIKHMNSSLAASPLDSNEFKDWFKGSKVVNEDGSPRMVFHGTTEEVKEIDMEKVGKRLDSGFLGRGFYMTSSSKTADYYAAVGSAESPNVMPLYVSMKNPYMWGKKTLGVRGELLQGKGIPSDIRESVFKRAGFIFDAKAEPDFAMEETLSKALRDELIDRGYDGVIAEVGETETEIVAFDGKQVKSAIAKKATNTSKQIGVAAKGSVVIAKVLVPENAEKAIEESGVKPETEKSVSEIKNNPKAFGSILHTFGTRSFFGMLDSRMSNLSKRVKAFVADMVATKNRFAETYQVMSEVKGVDNKRLGFMLGWTTVNERQLTKDEFHKMYPQSPDKVYEAYISALDAMKVGRDTILDAAKNMNDQVMKRLEARQDVLLDRLAELQDQIEEANKEGKSGTKEMIELKNKLRGEELSRTRVEDQIKEQEASFKELVDILSKRDFYWPLSRFGKFKVEVKDKKTGERVGIFFMEDKSEASKAKLLEDIKLQALADAALGDAFKNDRLSVGSPLELVDLGDDITGQSPFNVDGAMLSFLDAAQKISEDTKGELEAAVMSAKAMETLKNHMKERKGIPGWSTDAFKVFDTYIHSLSSNVANMKHSLLMDDELKKFTQENAGEAYDSDLHATARGFVEHAKRPPNHKWVNTVLGAGFVMHIGARASFAIAQLGQLAGSVYPALGQFYGYINAMQAITAALPIAIGTVGWTKIDKFELITKENVTKWVNKRMSPSAFRMASSDPKVREHISTVCKEMVVRAADSGSLQAAPTFGFADNIIKSAGEQIASKAGVIALKFEQINRLTTLISWGILNATQGEVKLSDSTGFIKDTAASTQTKLAAGDKTTIDNIYDVGETVNELSNYIRGRGNQPKYLRYRGGVGAALRLAFNYKSFPIGWLTQFHALGLLSARKAGGGKFKQTLAYARPQLVGMGVQAMMAGPKGIMYFKLLEMLLSAFDEPEEWMLNFFEEVSKELHKVIRKGMKAVGMDPDKNKELAIYMHHACINGLPTASGVDPSAMFEGDLVTVKGSTPETVGNFLMGATGSSFAAAIDKTIKTGSIVDGMKMLTPSAIKGPVEAISGETSVGGGKVELSKFGRTARALGFQPTSVQIQRNALNTKFKVQSFVRSQGKEFATEFAKFYDGGKNPDNESIEELKKEVLDFNTRNKELLEKYNVRGISASEIRLQAKSARKNLKVSDRIVQEGVSARDEE